MARRPTLVAARPSSPTMSRTSTRTSSSRYVSTSSPLGYEASSAGLIACEGYLRLKKRSALTWSTRFVILRGNDLYVFYSKQDATLRRNLVDALELASGKIAPKMDLALELLTTDKREFQARVFSRGDLARWVTAFHRLAIRNETAAAIAAAGTLTTKNKKSGVRHDSGTTESEPESPRTRSASPVNAQEDQEFNPVIQNGEARRPSDRRRVAFHGSVMVRMIPSVPQEQVAELFYTKAEVERFTAQAASIFSRTEDAVSCACLALRRPALPWRSRQQVV